MALSSLPTTGLTDAQLRATPVPVSGTVTATTGGLTDTQLRATPVPVSGTVTATTGGLTDTQLRATAVPVSGTVTATGPLTDTQLRAAVVPVKDDNSSFQALTVTLVASTDTTVTFAQAVRLVHIKNFDTANRVKVKNGAIASDSDTSASWVGVSPVANVPCGDWFPFATTTLHLRSAGASEVQVEGFY